MSTFSGRFLSGSLAGLMILSMLCLSAGATGMPPIGGGSDGPGGPGGEGGPPAPEGAPASASILVDGDKVTAEEAYQDNVKTADGKTVVSGLKFVGAEFADTAIVANNKADLEIKDSDITMNVATEVKGEGFGPAAKYYVNGEEVKAGMAAAADNGSKLSITNSKITVNGAGRYTVAAYNDATLVVNDSSIIAGGSLAADGKTDGVLAPMSNGALLISGTSRSNFSIGQSHTFYYNSECIAEGWAALSTDSATGDGLELVAYNTYAEATNGGYGTYADTNCRDYLYGVKFNSAEVGAIISNNGEINVASGADAETETTKDNHKPLENMAEDGQKTEEGSVIYAQRNCFQMHSPDMMGEGVKGYSARLNVKNSTLTTVPSENLAATTTEDYAKTYGEAVGAYVDYIMGSDLLVKSTGAEIDLNNVEMESFNGVLVQSIPNSDSMSRYLKAGNEGCAVNVAMHNMDEDGDFVHDDYQRDMNITLDGTTLFGGVHAATAESWAAQWSAYAEGENAASWAKLNNETYNTDTHATTMTLTNDSVWTVEEDSTLTKLDVQDTSMVVVPNQVTLTVGDKTYTNTVITKDGEMGESFTDVASNAWYNAPVTAVAAKGIVSGVGGGLFAPESNVTRAEAVTMLVKAQKLTVDEKAESVFSDVAADAWYTPYVTAAQKAGLVYGDDVGTFRPEDSVTRAEMAAMLVNAKGVTAVEGAKTFTDVPADAWYAGNVAKASAAGFVSGKSATTFGPEDTATRAEFAQIVFNAYLK